MSADGLSAVERADDLHLQVAREAEALGAVAGAVHDDRRGVVLALRVPGARDHVAEAAAAARRPRAAAPWRPLPLSTITLVCARVSFGAGAAAVVRLAAGGAGFVAFCFAGATAAASARCWTARESGFASSSIAAPSSSTSSIAATVLATSVARRHGRIELLR